MKTEITNSTCTAKHFLSPNRFGSIAIIFLLLICLSLVAQAQTKVWDKTFGGSHYDDLTSVIATPDGGYLLGGSSLSGASGDKTEQGPGGNCGSGDPYECNNDFWVVKTDSNGNKLWDRTFGDVGINSLTTMVATPDGGYLLGGNHIPAVDAFYSDILLIKIDGRGNMVWRKIIWGSDEDYIATIVASPAGGYLIGASSSSGVGYDKTEPNRSGFCDSYVENCPLDYWVVKIDEDGNKEWDKTIGGTGPDRLSQIVVTPDRGYLLAGSSTSDISGDKTQAQLGGYWVVKLDTLGKKQWDKTIKDSPGNLADIIPTPDGGYLLGGSLDSVNAEQERIKSSYWVVKVNGEGTEEWIKRYKKGIINSLNSLTATTDGNFMLGGSYRTICEVSSQCTYNFWALKVNQKGNILWDETYGGDGFDDLKKVIQTPDGGYLLGGISSSGVSGDKTEASRGGLDYWVVKIRDDTAPRCDQAVQSFTLVNGDTNRDITPLQEGSVIDLSSMPSRNLRIRANTSPSVVGSIVFHLDGQQAAVENSRPYRFGGIGKLTTGTHTLMATPYCGSKGSGGKGTALTLRFEVVDLAVQSFTLVNAHNGKDIMTLADGATLDLEALPTRQLNIRANTKQRKGINVALTLSGAQTYSRLELGFPYALFGDENGNYRAWFPAPGSYTLTATPYWDAKSSGSAGKPLTIHFEVVGPASLSKAQVANVVDLESLGSTVQAAPNPFTNQTAITFTVAEQGPATLEVYDLKGALVERLFQQQAESGKAYIVYFKRKKLQNGVYITRLSTTSQLQFFKLVLTQ